MPNTEIFGFHEEIDARIDQGRVHVLKHHVRTVFDAAVPPGQTVAFEFYVATLPIYLAIIQQGANIGTTERRPGGRPAGRVARWREVLTVDPREGVFPVVVARQQLPDDLAAYGGVEIGDIDFDPGPPPDFVVPFEITLTPPNGLNPIVLTNPLNSTIRTWPTERFGPDFIERSVGKWDISVKNINPDARRMQVSLASVHAIAPVIHRDIPLSLLNNLSAVALQKATPTIEYDRGHFVISTPTHFLDLIGFSRRYSLGSVAAKVIDDLPTFTPLSAKMMSRADFVARLEQRREDIRAEFQDQVREAVTSEAKQALAIRMNRAINACEVAIRQLEGLAESAAAFCIVLEGMFTDPEIEIRWVGTIAEVENRIPQLGIVFSEEFRVTTVISTLAVDLSPLLVKETLATAGLVLLGGLALGALGAALALYGAYRLFNSINSSDYLDIEEQIRSRIRDKGPMIAQYVKRALERLTDVGAVALRVRIQPGAAADGLDNLHVQCFNPSTLGPPRPWTPAGDVPSAPVEGAETLQIGTGELSERPVRAVTYVPRRRRPGGAPLARRSGERAAPYVKHLIGLSRETPGPLPRDFVVRNPETLTALDDHDCIAVVMMENRSYSHFFHELPLAYPSKGYRRAPTTYRNTAPPGFTEPFTIVGNTSIGIGNSLIFSRWRSTDPSHNKEHTWFQIGGGTDDTVGTGQMQGFAADFAKKSDSPQIVMSHFSIDALQVYKGLARYYPVCDRWFAALPVGTYPNRLAGLQGNVPFLYNVHMDDPALGYLEDYSIFDLLNSQGISWKFFESDIGTIRLYDRFRLDVGNVRPIGDLAETLRLAGAGGSLPRVMFIEPQFLFGNDDHPPMDVQQGQDFIRDVVGLFIKHGLLQRTLFVITYDEHGGFFDHVPPPGTPEAGPEYGPVEILFPQSPGDAPSCLGVRVPSLVLSRWAAARANRTVLDHTAIVKSILLHNRDRISTDQFGRFGERVKKRAHLGQVLGLPSPRSIDYAEVARAIGYRDTVPRVRNAVVASRSFGMAPTHPANVLRGIALPRGRTIGG